MRGGPPVVPFFYDLPNVPYVMYYHDGYGVHGTYWHDKFGTRQSSGCTNLTQGDAKFIFSLTTPILNSGQNSVLSTPDNPGTVVYNHY
jgi:lipoprotein-anchoring transpeptidase ErfK/SrfK